MMLRSLIVSNVYRTQATASIVVGIYKIDVAELRTR